MKQKTKGLISCSIGNALEWYDFIIYGYFSATIGKLFFPEADGHLGLLLSFSVFASGFLARPIGAVVFGHIGDKTSRKTALLLAIYLMIIPTVLIGCLPTYSSIGMAAPILLIVMRIIQGLALGGGFSSSMVFLVEHATKNRQGLFGSFSTCSLVAGVIVGSLVSALVMYTLDEQSIFDFGWRIPFLLSLASGSLALYMRKNISDSEQYTKDQAKQDKSFIPIKELLFKHCKKVFIVIFLDFLTAVGFFMITIFLPVYFQQFVGIPVSTAQCINTINMFIFAIMVLLGGWLSDKVGYISTLAASSFIFMISSYPVFMMFQLKCTLAVFFGQMILILSLGIFFGAIPVAIVKIFPNNLRVSGVGLAHNISMALFGGTAPALGIYILGNTNNMMSPAYLLIIAGFISLISTQLYKIENKTCKNI